MKIHKKIHLKIHKKIHLADIDYIDFMKFTENTQGSYTPI